MDRQVNKITNAISIIIPVCNRAENTKKLIDELIYQKNNYYPETQIIVIENNSTEDMSFLYEYNNITLIKTNKIKTAGAARNLGLKKAKGQYICFIDNDDFITRDYLHILYQTMRETDCD